MEYLAGRYQDIGKLIGSFAGYDQWWQAPILH